MAIRPIIVPSDFDGFCKIASINNEESVLTILLDNNGTCHIPQEPEGPEYSCLIGSYICQRKEAYLCPIDYRYLFLAFAVANWKGLVSLDLLDEWRASLILLCETIKSCGKEVDSSLMDLSEEGAIVLIINMIKGKCEIISESNLYKDYWLTCPNVKKRWHKKMYPPCFILDLLQPILGCDLLNSLCRHFEIDPPKDVHPSTLEQESTDKENKSTATKNTKKSKITAEDTKGHRSLTSFFKKI